MEMQWGWLTPLDPQEIPQDQRCGCGAQHSDKWDLLTTGGERISPAVIFRGVQKRAQGVDFVLLGGSRRHVLSSGAESDPSATVMEAGSGSLLSALVCQLEGYVSQLERFKPSERYRYSSHEGSETRFAIEAGMFMRMKPASRQRLNFLAVPYGQAAIKIKDGTLYGVIGTPIYVRHG
jgi:hypothetical protein